MTISDVRKRIENDSVQAVVAESITRAKDDMHNALIEIVEDRAIDRSKELDQIDIADRKKLPLFGIPFVAKDNILTRDSHSTAASKILDNFSAPYQAEAIERLEQAGAVCIGKVNLDSFGHGGSTENSFFGPTLNPHDKRRVAGGSSGGSAAAVAADIVPFALGTDTGGSIREPASFCGVVGLKPSYGSVSRYGVIAMASSTDVVGVLANSVIDVEAVMRVVSGRDSKDSTTIDSPYDKTAQHKKRIGVIKEWFGNGVDDEVENAVTSTISRLEGLGYQAEEVSLPILESALAIYYVIVPAEIASNLARYDGVRYGNRSENNELKTMFRSSRSAGLMPETKRRILIGNYILSSGYYDAYYKKAAQARTLLLRGFTDIFDQFDALVGPVAPTSAFELGHKSDPLSMYMMDKMTVPASLAGLPAISVPVKTSGMPVGIQIVAAQNNDAALLTIAEDIEAVNS